MIYFKALVAASAIAVAASAAQAAVITATNLGEGDAAIALVDVNAGTSLSPNVTSFDAAIVTGSHSYSRSPYDGSGNGTAVPNFQQLSYFSVGTSQENSPSVATMLLSSASNTLSLLWGSIDGYNKIEFFANNVSIGDIDNTDVTTGEPAGRGATFVKISSDMAFDKIVFSSTSNAFEFANVTVAPVPLPAAGLMLLAGLGGLAAAKRRKAA